METMEKFAGLTQYDALHGPNDVVCEKILSAMREDPDLVLVHFHPDGNTERWKVERFYVCEGYANVRVDEDGEADCPDLVPVGVELDAAGNEYEVPSYLWVLMLYQGQIKLDSFVSGGYGPTEH